MRLLATSRVSWRGAMAQRHAARLLVVLPAQVRDRPPTERASDRGEEYALRDAGGQRLARSINSLQ